MDSNLHLASTSGSQKGALLDEARLDDFISRSLIDLSMELQEPEPLLSMMNVPLFSRGNISGIGGLAKSRKTFLIVYLLAKFLDENPEKKALLIDTEMSLFYVIKSAKRIHQLVGWETALNNDRLQVLSLREYTPGERKEILVRAVERCNADLVFLDGIRDLLKDFNNIEESNDVIDLAMKLSSKHDCHICSVLHENKIGGQLRGHLGAELVHKSEVILGVSTSGLTTTVKPLSTRNIPFEEFNFRINEEGLPELCDPDKQKPNTDKLKKLMQTVMSGAISLTYTELTKRLHDNLKVCDRTCQRKIREAKEFGILDDNAIGHYVLVEQMPKQESLPL